LEYSNNKHNPIHSDHKQDSSSPYKHPSPIKQFHQTELNSNKVKVVRHVPQQQFQSNVNLNNIQNTQKITTIFNNNVDTNCTSHILKRPQTSENNIREEIHTLNQQQAQLNTVTSMMKDEIILTNIVDSRLNQYMDVITNMCKKIELQVTNVNVHMNNLEERLNKYENNFTNFNTTQNSSNNI